MYAIKAIYDGTNFKPMQPIPVKENYEVAIIFIEPVKENAGDLNKPKKRPRSEFIGLFEGKVWMSDDFNEPLEEMKEYME
jgi:predicted DNA-binding antitoxin AbrB/MazE fold protein